MIITLLTDFGTQDYFVGAMKGAILSVNPEAKIVDITHDIPPQGVRTAAFTLANYYKTFPTQTVHVCVVDPGVGSNRRAILVETEEYFFVAPDNGLLSFLFAECEFKSQSRNLKSNYRVFELKNEKYFRQPVSQTFHGRDVFAPVAGHLTAGISSSEFGGEIKDFVQFEMPQPRRNSDDAIEAEIVHIDRFGNLITNLKTEDLPERFILEVNGKWIEKHQKYYAEAETGEIFSIMGSAGFLEIVAFQDSAKDLLNAKTGEKVILTESGKWKTEN